MVLKLSTTTPPYQCFLVSCINTQKGEITFLLLVCIERVYRSDREKPMVRFLTSVLRSPEPKKLFQNFNLCVVVVFAFARTVQISHIAPDQGFTRHSNKPPLSGVTRAIEMRMGTLQILSPCQPKLGIPRSRTNLSKHHLHLQKSIQVSDSRSELFSSPARTLPCSPHLGL